MTKIIEIWNENFNDSLSKIKILLKDCQFVAMDTEFPGTVTKTFSCRAKSQEYYFQTLRLNVDSLRLIQLGISFGYENNGSIKIKNCLQFNFKFSLSEKMFAQDSIDLLLRSGVDFECHKNKGIPLKIFTTMLMKSNLIFNQKIYWISFHSGYDFGYLIKILSRQQLPKNIGEFLKIIEFYFPNFYDVKYLNLFSGNFKGGLNKLAKKLSVDRIGQVHQAGSDSVLTLSVFDALKSTYFFGKIEKKFNGILFGLNDIQNEKCITGGKFIANDTSNFICK